MKINKAYLFLLPSVAFFTVFTLTPVVMMGVLSLFKTDYITSEFVGLRNYVNALTEPAFRQAIVNSLIYCMFTVTLGTSISLFVALTAYRHSHVFRDFVRFAFMIPSLAAGVVIANAWKWIFDYRRGLANYLLSVIGMEPVMWFGHQITAIVIISLIVVNLWIGGWVILYLAILTSVRKEVIDSAKIDGASWWQIQTKILIPLIAPWILFIILLQIISTFQIWENIYLLTSGGPTGSTATVVYNIYDTGFLQSRYGIASAKSMILVVIIMGLALAKNKLEKRK